jgi:hypothetical protein
VLAGYTPDTSLYSGFSLVIWVLYIILFVIKKKHFTQFEESFVIFKHFTASDRPSSPIASTSPHSPGPSPSAPSSFDSGAL